MTQNEYHKTKEQIRLEDLIRTILTCHFTISELQMVHRSGKTGTFLSDDTAHRQLSVREAGELYQEFNHALYFGILAILHETRIHSSIRSLADSTLSRYDETARESDLFTELASMTYFGLYSRLKKGDHQGELRIDTWISDVDHFYMTLRSYITRNIICDHARMVSAENQKRVLEKEETEDDKKEDPFSRLQSSPETMENEVLSKFNCNSTTVILTAVLSRFLKRKPAAAYLLGRQLLGEYESAHETRLLQSMDFQQLFHSVLTDLETEFDASLEELKNTPVDAERWLSSLREIPFEPAKKHVQQLASQAKKEFYQMEIIRELEKDHVMSGNYVTLLH